MSTLFLTEDTTFTCNKGGIIQCSDRDNCGKKIKSTTILTTGASVSSRNGICATLTSLANGAPQQCRCQLTKWLGHSIKCTVKFTLSNKYLLTSDSFFFCPIGQGKVSVSQMWFTHVKTGFATGSVSKGKARTIEPIASESQAASKNTALGQPYSTAALGAVVPPQSGPQTANTQGTQNPDAESKSEEDKERKKSDSKLFCPIDRRTSKCKECSYPNASTNVDNNSIILRKNWENATPEPCAPWDEHYRELIGEFGHSKWKYAAHHIISGMQVFKPNIEIVRLANFYGYDINNADNCIMLVSNIDDYGNRIGGKAVNAYETMSESKIQWHVGGHSYKFDEKKTDELIKRIKYMAKPADIYDFYASKEPEIKSYAKLLEDELEKIKTSMCQNKVCRNTPDQKAAFFERIAALTQKVEKKLGSFKEKRTHSFPYYVSVMAFEYAFGLPRSAKLVLASREESGSILLEKFRVTRFTVRDHGLSFDQIESKGNEKLNPSSFSLGTINGREQCINFCENILYFIVTDGVDKNELSFMVDDQSEIFTLPDKPQLNTRGSEFLQQWQSEIIVWLNDVHKSYTYTSPMRKIKERLARLDKGGL